MAVAMEFLNKLNHLFRPARLSRRRMVLALLVALGADALQIPLQLPPLPEIIDVVAMLLTSALIGFHLLLLPTFAIEFIPVVGMLPTWTGCVAAVIALRLREAKEPRADLPEAKPPRIAPPPVQSEPPTRGT
jgi:NAD/NADP transhydrogenase beta subunit